MTASWHVLKHRISHTSHMTQVMACSMSACGCTHTEEYMALSILEASCLADERHDVGGKGPSS